MLEHTEQVAEDGSTISCPNVRCESSSLHWIVSLKPLNRTIKRSCPSTMERFFFSSINLTQSSIAFHFYFRKKTKEIFFSIEKRGIWDGAKSTRIVRRRFHRTVDREVACHVFWRTFDEEIWSSFECEGFVRSWWLFVYLAIPRWALRWFHGKVCDILGTDWADELNRWQVEKTDWSTMWLRIEQSSADCFLSDRVSKIEKFLLRTTEIQVHIYLTVRVEFGEFTLDH